MNLALIPGTRLPALIATAGDQARMRFLEFFAANIRNPNTRRAYGLAVREFLLWCEQHRVTSIAAVAPVHVAGYIEQLTRERSAPTAKQHLAAIRHLFDWLVVGQVVPINPAASVRGPRHVVKRGKTPVLSPDEAARLLAGEGQSAPQIAEPFGVHETTIYRCLATQESRPYGIYEPTDN